MTRFLSEERRASRCEAWVRELESNRNELAWFAHTAIERLAPQVDWSGCRVVSWISQSFAANNEGSKT